MTSAARALAARADDLAAHIRLLTDLGFRLAAYWRRDLRMWAEAGFATEDAAGARGF